MTEITIVGRIVHGQVKWFDPVKGFGFILSDEGGPDILLHANVLRNFGQSSVAEGTRIEVEVNDTERGIQAMQVITLSPSLELEEVASEVTGQRLLEGEAVVPARVKWFDKAKGFGFANVFGSAEDVFIHVETLRLAGLAELQPGEAIAVQVVDGERGRMAATVTSWEAAATLKEPK